MELDLKSIKALASPTRASILREILQGEQTTTTLSEHLGKAKSTVKNHLETLQSAGLIERDDVDGRKRVVYHPTTKAKALSDSRSKKVKVSFLTSALTGGVSAALYFAANQTPPTQYTQQTTGVTTEAQTADAAANTVTTSPNIVFLIIATTLLIVALTALWHGLLVRRLRTTDGSTTPENQ